MQGLKKIIKLQKCGKPIIGFDIDGTLTDFEGFLEKYSPSYMQKKYCLIIQNRMGYDIDELYRLGGKREKESAIAKQFWNRFYVRYCFGYPLRKDAGSTIKRLKEKYAVVIFTSRNRACKKGVVGWFVRMSTRLQLWINGVYPDAIIFFEDDVEKCTGINQGSLAAMVDDKPEVLAQIKGCTKICVASYYNEGVEGCVRVKALDEVLEVLGECQTCG